MGNNLSVLHKGKLIACLARKHNFTFYGNDSLPTKEEIDEELSDSRKHIQSTLIGYAAWLSAQDEDANLTEHIDDIVTSIKDLLDNFEYDVSVAARNWVLEDLVDQYDDDGQISNDIEVVDDFEMEKRIKQDEKDAAAKIKYFEDLRDKLEKMDFDAVEHQTSEVDLDFEKDTLTGEKWRDQLCDNLDEHNQSIEEIGYCSYCRQHEKEEEEYLERQNYN